MSETFCSPVPTSSRDSSLPKFAQRCAALLRVSDVDEGDAKARVLKYSLAIGYRHYVILSATFGEG